MSAWQDIATAPKEIVQGVMPTADLWLNIPASPKSMGWADQFRVTDCWMDCAGKWVHDYNGKETELDRAYITHWMPIPEPPNPEGP